MSKTLSIDFTSCDPASRQYPSFSDEVTRFIRSELPAKCLMVVDYGYGLPSPGLALVVDHLNLTGSNPLVGPNNPCGERFPRVTDVYITDLKGKLPNVITAGLKQGIQPNSEEVSAVKSIGGECWSYNLVPTMIVAAHAGLKVLGILLPEGTTDKTKFKAELESIWQSVSGDKR